MDAKDKRYLTLQFKNKIYAKSMTEFQSFFEGIMLKAYDDFKMIRPYGKDGDRGNDGFRPQHGIYYQAYSPINPNEKEAEAAKKMSTDFEKVKKYWDNIAKIKNYYFVYNNKFAGSTIKLFEMRKELAEKNQDIDFDIFTPDDLLDIFVKLSTESIKDLGFDTDSRRSLELIYSLLDKAQTLIYRTSYGNAINILDCVNESVKILDDENLTLEYMLLNCNCLIGMEKVETAIDELERITKLYLNDPRAYLILADIYLESKNIKGNEELLEKANQIDNDYWLLRYQLVKRSLRLGLNIDLKKLNEKEFGDSHKQKSNFYRLYSLLFEKENQSSNADSFIEKAIIYNPDAIANYIVKLSLIENRMVCTKTKSTKLELAKKILSEIDKLHENLLWIDQISTRSIVSLNNAKLSALSILEKYMRYEKIASKMLYSILECYFDLHMESALIRILDTVNIPIDTLSKLLQGILSSKIILSDNFLKILMRQFISKNILYTDGASFYKNSNNPKYANFINNLECKKYDDALQFLEKDINFALDIGNILKDHPALRKRIIETVPDNMEVEKNKSLLYLYYDEMQFEKAYKILKKLNMSCFYPNEYQYLLIIAEKNEDWSFTADLLEKMIPLEKDKERKFNLKIDLINTSYYLGQHDKLIQRSQELLEINLKLKLLKGNRLEQLIATTISSCFKRSSIESESLTIAESLMEKYSLDNPSFDYLISIEAETYYKLNKFEDALKSIVKGVKLKKSLTAVEYANLNYMLGVKLGSRANLNLDNLDLVKDDSYVKLKDYQSWFYLGDGNELDAIKLKPKNPKYCELINKLSGDEVEFDYGFGKPIVKHVIEHIFTIEKYLLWQAAFNFQKLAPKNNLENVIMIPTPQDGDEINLEHLFNFMEKQERPRTDFFQLYCNNNIPLMYLAEAEGGITGALSRICSESKGFVHFSSGDHDYFIGQSRMIYSILRKKEPFFLSPVSAMILIESGMYLKLCENITNMLVTQSTINFLIEATEKLNLTHNQMGYLGFARGKIVLTELENNDIVRNKFIDSIKILESREENIRNLSNHNIDENSIYSKLTHDARETYLLAKAESIPILNDDGLLDKYDKSESANSALSSFSSYALISICLNIGLISFKYFVDFIGYLSSYRFRFIHINYTDIVRVVFDYDDDKLIRPKNIYRLNLKLLLSEEYGVPFNDAVIFICNALLTFMLNIDNKEMLKEIFEVLIDSFPTDKSNKELADIIIDTCKSNFDIAKGKQKEIASKKSIIGKIEHLRSCF